MQLGHARRRPVAEVGHARRRVGRRRRRLVPLLLVLRVSSVVVARAPTRVELQVQLLLLPRHLVVLLLLLSVEAVPLKSNTTHYLFVQTHFLAAMGVLQQQ